MSNGTQRGRIGRFLTAIGFVWIFWAVITSMGILDLQFGRSFVSVPILPGIILLFVGRLIRRSSGRARDDDDETVEEQQAAAQRPTPMPIPAPVSYTHLTLPTIYSV